MTIQSVYEEKCATSSDINQLLPYLKEYAEKCEHITELGIRNPTSTYAFLASGPKKLVSYDIGRYPEVSQVETLAKEAGLDFEFKLEDVLEANIEETDFIFFDTYHTSEQLKRELERHAHKSRKFLGFHDIVTFWESGELPYESVAAKGVNSNLGLKYALEPFLENNPEWVTVLRLEINNGLLILGRK